MRSFAPKRRLDSEFVNALYHNAEVVTKDFAQHFVDLPRKRLVSDAIALGAMERLFRVWEMALRGGVVVLWGAARVL
jgi:hypothetical protein